MKNLDSQLKKYNAPFEIFSNKDLIEVQTDVEGRFEVICPVTKEIDNLWLKIRLIPNSEGAFIEYTSFHEWLISISRNELGIEGSCNLIYEAIYNTCSPTILEVTVHTGFKSINQKAFRTNQHNYLEKR